MTLHTSNVCGALGLCEYWSRQSKVRQHQEKKCASRRTGCVLTHQALRTLRTHPGSAHTAPNAKRTGNVNSDAARHSTMRPGAARHGICLPDGGWQGIFVLDARCQGIFLLDARCQGIFLLDAAVSGHFPSGRRRVRAFSFWTQPCQGIFLLDAAVSGHFPSGHSRVRAFSFWTQQCRGKWHPDDACHGTVVTLAVKSRNIAANTRIAFTNTQRLPGIVTQSSSILHI